MISFLIEKDSKQSTASQVKDPPLLLSLSGIGSTGEVSNLFFIGFKSVSVTSDESKI